LKGKPESTEQRRRKYRFSSSSRERMLSGNTKRLPRDMKENDEDKTSGKSMDFLLRFFTRILAGIFLDYSILKNGCQRFAFPDHARHYPHVLEGFTPLQSGV